MDGLGGLARTVVGSVKDTLRKELEVSVLILEWWLLSGASSFSKSSSSSLLDVGGRTVVPISAGRLEMACRI